MTPGLIHNMRSSVYHADPCPTPSLSSGVARTIIGKSAAHAYLEHTRLGGKKTDPTAEMVLGGYVHAHRSGKQSELDEFCIGVFDNFLTNKAREWRDSVKAEGKTPILEKTVDQAHLISKALRDKAALGVTRDPFETGQTEVTGIWQEDSHWFRARFDNLDADQNGFADVWDWKTTHDISEDAITRAIIDKGYHTQAAFYLRALEKLMPEYRGRTSFILVFVETEAPFAVRRRPLSEGFLQIGRALADRAITQWKWSMEANSWPEGGSDSRIVEPPDWYVRKIMEAAA